MSKGPFDCGGFSAGAGSAAWAASEVQDSEPDEAEAFAREELAYTPGLEVHTGVACDFCDMAPIRGQRIKCTTYPNFDLCYWRADWHLKHHHNTWQRMGLSTPSSTSSLSILFHCGGQTFRLSRRLPAKTFWSATARRLELHGLLPGMFKRWSLFHRPSDAPLRVRTRRLA